MASWKNISVDRAPFKWRVSSTQDNEIWLVIRDQEGNGYSHTLTEITGMTWGEMSEHHWIGRDGGGKLRVPTRELKDFIRERIVHGSLKPNLPRADVFKEAKMTYSAEFWGSHKDLGNDDHWIGGDAETFEGAKEIFDKIKADYLKRNRSSDWAYACIEGPEGRLHEETNPDFVASRDDDYDADRSEFAMQQGMAHGTRGYNEAMGYDTDEPEDAFRP